MGLPNPDTLGIILKNKPSLSQGVRDGHICTVIFKTDNQQEPTYSIWNSVQCYMAPWMGGVFGGERIHVYVWLSPFAVHLKVTHWLLTGCTPIQVSLPWTTENIHVALCSALGGHSSAVAKCPTTINRWLRECQLLWSRSPQCVGSIYLWHHTERSRSKTFQERTRTWSSKDIKELSNE